MTSVATVRQAFVELDENRPFEVLSLINDQETIKVDGLGPVRFIARGHDEEGYAWCVFSSGKQLYRILSRYPIPAPYFRTSWNTDNIMEVSAESATVTVFNDKP
jgi:hypothetical protein